LHYVISWIANVFQINRRPFKMKFRLTETDKPLRINFELVRCFSDYFNHRFKISAKTLPAMTALPDRHAGYNKRRLFLLSVIALTTTGIGFSIRGNIASELQADLFDPIDKLHSAEMVATALGVVFLGYACTIAIGSPLLDFIGMGRLLRVSAICFFAGTAIVLCSRTVASAQSMFSLFRVVWVGMLIIGIGQGLVETVINPLAATLYPDDKTHKLNVLHASNRWDGVG
jgi:Dipeptide/tripeptide permease